MSGEVDEDRRRRALETRQAHSKMATMLTQGLRYHEKMTVRFLAETQPFEDREIQVYVLSSADIQAAFEAAGADLKDIADIDRIPMGKKLKLMQIVAAKATMTPDIAEKLWPLEDAKIADKAFNISGLKGGVGSPKAA